jgi:hypothetical protein
MLVNNKKTRPKEENKRQNGDRDGSMHVCVISEFVMTATVWCQFVALAVL